MLKLLCCVVLVVVNELVRVESGSTGDFKCYPNQTIHFINPNAGLYTYYRAFYDDGGLTNCTGTDYNSNADILFDCGTTTTTVTAYFSSRSLSNDDILGGQSITYTFTCDAISPYEDGLSDYLDVSVNETAESATADYDITAAFYDGSGNEITEAAVGDLVYFIIKAPAEFTLLPKTCTASGDNSESAALTTNGCSNDTSLMDDFTNSVVGLNIEYSADFYVFKFYNSDSVTVECLVKVCPGSGDCSSGACDRRKRRAIADAQPLNDDDTKMSTVGRRLRIVDRALGGSDHVYSSFVTTFLMSLCVILMGYQRFL